MAVAGGSRSSEPGQASAPGGAGDTSLLSSATTWPLKRYGRFLPPTDGDDEGGQNTSSWKVFESNEESGYLILTIVVSGHFFISQGRTVLHSLPQKQDTQKDDNLGSINKIVVESEEDQVAMKKFPMAGSTKHNGRWFPSLDLHKLDGNSGKNTLLAVQDGHDLWFLTLRTSMKSSLCENSWSLKALRVQIKQEGFSLIDSHNWLKIVRRADCLLLRAQSKNECRMFRVQFGGDSKEQMLEHCCNCVQKLAEYLPVQVTDERSQQLYHSLDQLANGENQVKDTEQNASVLHTPDEPLPDSCLGERRSVAQLAQSVLKQKFELPLGYRHSVWRAQELGPFIRLCLMDQNFPAFVEDVEKELKKLTEG